MCTGDYQFFFEGFYSSFRTHFAPECKKTFYVFTDDESIGQEKEDVVTIPIENLPWPLVTLLRFHYICGNKEQFEAENYLAFCNINLVCKEQIPFSDVCPRSIKREKMTYVLQPGWAEEKGDNCPFERSKESLAYIPMGSRADYVMGSLFLGKKDAFLSLCEELDENIRQDLRHNVIAVWHDESHLNAYAFKHKQYRILDPSYMYPEESGWGWPYKDQYKEKISYLDKTKYIDVVALKDRWY